MVDGSMLDRIMFADTIDSSASERARRGWTTLTSFGVQALITGMLLLLPLLRPMGLPTAFRQISTPISLGQPLVETQPARPHGNFGATPIHPTQFFFHRPSPLPNGFRHIADDVPSDVSGSGPYVPGIPQNGDPRGLPNMFGNGTQAVLPVAPPTPAAHTLRLSHMDEGDLIRKVQPVYPTLARSARIQGMVVLQAVIGKQGSIENLRVLSGHPMLVQAAVEAVRQWRYRPYILNHEPVEVETQITVNFALGSGG